MRHLVIVESPTKAKTLARFLGKDYRVLSSRGHVRDLPKSKLGVDVDHDFALDFVTIRGKGSVISELKKAKKGIDTLWLACDLDREGESIAWHLSQVLGFSDKDVAKPSKKFKRVVFHEITKEAISAAFASPRGIDLSLVNAQKARRVLDRLVGYKLSPLLWRKVQSGLSAGRVQSVAVRFVVEREKERRDFSQEQYFTIPALVQVSGSATGFPVELKEISGQRIESTEKRRLFAGSCQITKTTLVAKERAEEIIVDLPNHQPIVKSVEASEVQRNPYPPFTTAQLQTSAASLGFSPAETMQLAQSLYEEGLITYHRTDSRNLAESAIDSARRYINDNYGKQYLPDSAITYQSGSKVAQEAHEAIRPTDFGCDISEVAHKLGEPASRLYGLIWTQTLACQMEPAVFLRTTISVGAGPYLFQGVGQVLKFEGWLKVSLRVRERYKESEVPSLREGQEVELERAEVSRHETTPPPRYSEASLVKELKKFDIGRPSTYAPIVSTIKARGYVVKEGGYFVPTPVAEVVNALLVEHFPNIVDVSFTAKMEGELDEIAQGEKAWVDVVRRFWEPFSLELTKKFLEIQREDVTVLEKLDETCPQCGKALVVKLGRYGKFVSCSGFPGCKYARPFVDLNKDGAADSVDQSQLAGGCPKCHGELVLKDGRFGSFVACSNYPKCKFTKPYLKKIGFSCPECHEGEVIIKQARRGRTFFGCSRYPKCRWASWSDPRSTSEGEAQKDPDSENSVK